ncbi:MAG: hypothetical protein KDC12_14620, partial [Flavobacteriales bacterium]|nr:hypothetical protein [Flavobacteriales bacterium]
MKKLLTTIFLACCSILPALAQQDLLIYHMTDVPQAGYVNVASRPTSRVNVGIPLLSSMYFRQQNTVFNPGNMF